MSEYSLVPHPDFPSSAIREVIAEWNPVGEAWPDEERGNRLLKFTVVGTGELLVPESRAPQRRDNLWTTTCFELFFRHAPNGYYTEYNFSPSGEWAAYEFAGYREGMRELAFFAPLISGTRSDDTYEIRINLDASVMPAANCAMSFTAVIEEYGARKSYWALAHPPGKPDFHNAVSFAA